jgi:hypothetical protein
MPRYDAGEISLESRLKPVAPKYGSNVQFRE